MQLKNNKGDSFTTNMNEKELALAGFRSSFTKWVKQAKDDGYTKDEVMEMVLKSLEEARKYRDELKKNKQ